MNFGVRPNFIFKSVLGKTFSDVSGYDDIVLLKDMRLESHCEHHIVPIIGKAHIAYISSKKVVGISKIARLLDVYCKKIANSRNSNCTNCQKII